MAKLNWLCFASLLAIAVPAAAQRAPLFKSEILPVLEKNCVCCYSDRLPTIEAKNSKPGRDHNPYGFSMWMAGSGMKPGFDFGQSDDLGYAVVKEFRV